jgi:hypothetical protein
VAKPRLFVSSTFYDLRVVRSDLERGVRDLGYDPVLHERGHVPYTKESTLEENCYREISNVDILVAIIGGRFGANASDGDHSISQQEIRTALRLNKQIYIFIDAGVLYEYRTYLLNLEKIDIKYAAVDNVQIFKFIDEVNALKGNNAMFPFETSNDIMILLREQLAGLFQDLLSQVEVRRTAALIDDLTVAISSLREITSLVSQSLAQDSEVVREVVLSSHPLFARLKSLLKVKYRVFFLNTTEMTTWLNVRRYSPIPESAWDKPTHMEFLEDDGETYLRIARSLFDHGGRLIPMRPDAWDNGLADLVTVEMSDGDD